MVQKRHQEEISGPQDTIRSAPFASELPRPKRSRRKTRKATENEAQRSEATVPPTPPSQIGINDTNPSNSDANRHQEEEIPELSDSYEKEDTVKWYEDFQRAKTKPEKLKILLQHIGPQKPFPQKLDISETLQSNSIPFPRRPFVFNPLKLFHLFIPRWTFKIIAGNTNKNARLEMAKESFMTLKKSQRAWEDITAADIGGYIGATLLLGVQPGSRDMAYYWDKDDRHPNFPLARFISRNRYQQITRYIKINCPNEQLATKDWWRKVDPLASK